LQYSGQEKVFQTKTKKRKINIVEIWIIQNQRHFSGVVMAGKSKRAALLLNEDQRTILNELIRSRTAQSREVVRAKVLLGYACSSAMLI
jgi:hypothetical protein